MTDGDPVQMLDYLDNDLPQGGSTQIYFSQPPSERYAVARALYDVYVDQGEDVVMNVIRQIRADAATLTTAAPDEAIAWIEEAARHAN